MGEWIPCTLGNVLTLQRGFDLPTQNRIAGVHPVVASTGIVAYHNEAKVTAPGVVIGRSGSIGGGQYLESDFWPLNTTLWVKDFYGNNERYCYYLLKSIDFSAFNVGSGVPTLNRNHIHPWPVLLPSRDEQDDIVQLLGSLDDKIELNRRTNETLEAMAQALFRDWFVTFGPVKRKMEGARDTGQILGGLIQDQKEAANIADLFPDTIGDDGLPEGWVEEPIGEVCETVGGATPPTKTEEYWENGQHFWATPKDLSNLTGLYVQTTERSISDAGLGKISSGLSPKGSVLMSSRAPIGYVAIASVPVAVNQGFIVMRPAGRFPTEFAYFWTKASMDLIKSNANGSTFQEISKKNFRPLPVLMPTVEVMSEFVNFTMPMLGLIEQREIENQTLAQTRDYLLPKLMSGQIRAGEAEGMAAA